MHLLGPDKVSTQFLFLLKNFDPNTTIGHLYSHANTVNDIKPGRPDDKSISKLKDIAEKYIDALEQKAIADTTRIVGEKIDNLTVEAKIKNQKPEDYIRQPEGQKILASISKELKDQRDKIKKAADVLVTHELHNAQNIGAFDGILGAAKSVGIDDPVVFKIGVLDEKRCRICWRLWTMPDKITPKVYKMSELSGSPGHWKNPDASVSPTHPNCFTEGRMPVLTETGWKAIKNVKVGEKVLTHTGKFKKVVGVINEPYTNKKNMIIHYEYNGRRFAHHVTPDHKFLTQRGWIEAKDLTEEDKFIQLNYPCVVCGKQTKFKHSVGFEMSKTCSQACFNELMRAQVKHYHDTLSIEQKSIRAANCSQGILKAYENGARSYFASQYWNEERRAQQRDKLISRLPQMMQASASTRISKKQRYVYSWIKDFYRQKTVEMEYQVGRYCIDIALVEDKIAIEIDGKYHEGDRIAKDQARDSWLKNQGWSVLRYGFKKSSDIKKDRVIADIQNILNNHDGIYSFQETKILSIKYGRTRNNGRVYCLTVEEDASFVARGIVSSNCRDILTVLMPGFGFEGSKIVYKGKDYDEYKKQRGDR
jgi:very-short-patch-repair endonuclease